MAGNLSTEDVQLIAGLINDKYDDLTKHMSKEIRMVKTTVQDNHTVAIETRDLAKKTNGRVTRLENETYGEVDTHGKIIRGREGMLDSINLIERWKWVYKYWQVPATITLLFLALAVPQSRDYIINIIDKIF